MPERASPSTTECRGGLPSKMACTSGTLTYTLTGSRSTLGALCARWMRRLHSTRKSAQAVRSLQGAGPRTSRRQRPRNTRSEQPAGRAIRPAARPSRAPFLLCQMEVVNRDLTTPGGEDCSYEILITAYGTIHRTRCTSTTTPFLWDVHVSRRTVAFPGVALHGTMT